MKQFFFYAILCLCISACPLGDEALERDQNRNVVFENERSSSSSIVPVFEEVFVGAWDSLTTYKKGDVVLFKEDFYLAQQEVSSIEPAENDSWKYYGQADYSFVGLLSSSITAEDYSLSSSSYLLGYASAQERYALSEYIPVDSLKQVPFLEDCDQLWKCNDEVGVVFDVELNDFFIHRGQSWQFLNTWGLDSLRAGKMELVYDSLFLGELEDLLPLVSILALKTPFVFSFPAGIYHFNFQGRPFDGGGVEFFALSEEVEFHLQNLPRDLHNLKFKVGEILFDSLPSDLENWDGVSFVQNKMDLLNGVWPVRFSSTTYCLESFFRSLQLNLDCSLL